MSSSLPMRALDGGAWRGTELGESSLDAGSGSRCLICSDSSAVDNAVPVFGACVDAPLPPESALPGTQPDWSEGAKVPLFGASNRFGYDEAMRVEHVRRGNAHAAMYPVAVTASWIPRRLLDAVFKKGNQNKPLGPLLPYVTPLAEFEDLDQFETWLGLHAYPGCDGQGARSVPFPDGQRPDYGMGSTRRELADGPAVTYGCAGCHSSRLFGRTLLGLQNRFPRANATAGLARDALGGIDPQLIASVYETSEGETRMLERFQHGLSYVVTRSPLVRGLDTSLAQVALSLATRDEDPYATRLDPAPPVRPDPLETIPADSKPGNWWVLKYKNRWLLDGSVVAGNPIYTNLLWNEIGRGTDLRELDAWVDSNPDVVEDLTAAVFNAQPARYTDFFSAESIDMEGAKRGKVSFDDRCASCHGTYEKAWQEPGAEAYPLVERLATRRVRYHESTPVFDVGTDAHRSEGMSSLTQLNRLAFSQKRGMIIRVQKGYVAPPLVGIWARFPYFHNNAAPSLCAVLTRGDQRPVTYYAGEANDPGDDFDAVCNGYPSGDSVPSAWRSDPDALYDTRKEGMGNLGHDEGIILQDGRELLSADAKRDLIEFLKTL